MNNAGYVLSLPRYCQETGKNIWSWQPTVYKTHEEAQQAAELARPGWDLHALWVFEVPVCEIPPLLMPSLQVL
jgi:hypothetical protein